MLTEYISIYYSLYLTSRGFRMTDNKIQEALMHFNSSFKSIRYYDFISLKYN